MVVPHRCRVAGVGERDSWRLADGCCWRLANSQLQPSAVANSAVSRRQHRQPPSANSWSAADAATISPSRRPPSQPDPLTRRARRAPLRSLPRPSRLAELGLKRKTRDAADALGLETVGDLIEHLPREHEDRRETRRVNRAPLERGRDRVRARAQRRGQADAPARPLADRGARERRDRAARGRLVQPAEVRGRPALARPDARPARPLQAAQPVPRVGARGRPERRRGARVAGARARLPRHRGAAARADPRADVARARPDARRRRAAAGVAARSPSGCPTGPRRSTRCTSRPTRSRRAAARDRLAFEELLLLELSLAARKRARADGSRAPLRSGERASSWTRGSRRCRSRRRGDQPSALRRGSSATSAGSARCSGC